MAAEVGAEVADASPRAEGPGAAGSLAGARVLVWDGAAPLPGGRAPTLRDVVLPLPGTGVVYPANERCAKNPCVASL